MRERRAGPIALVLFYVEEFKSNGLYHVAHRLNTKKLVLTIGNENLRQRTYYQVKLGTNENNAAV